MGLLYVENGDRKEVDTHQSTVSVLSPFDFLTSQWLKTSNVQWEPIRTSNSSCPFKAVGSTTKAKHNAWRNKKAKRVIQTLLQRTKEVLHVDAATQPCRAWQITSKTKQNNRIKSTIQKTKSNKLIGP